MTNSKKITKRENLGTLLDIVDKIEAEGIVFENEDMTCDTLREFINHKSLPALGDILKTLNCCHDLIQLIEKVGLNGPGLDG